MNHKSSFRAGPYENDILSQGMGNCTTCINYKTYESEFSISNIHNLYISVKRNSILVILKKNYYRRVKIVRKQSIFLSTNGYYPETEKIIAAYQHKICNPFILERP